MSDLPPLPPGFQLETAPSSGGGLPPLPPGFQLEKPAAQPAEAFNPALGAARDLVEGIPILGPLYTGAVDQLTSNVAGMFTGEDPAAIRDRRSSRHEQYQEENPILSPVAQMTGGAIALAPLGATAIGAKALGLTGPLARRALLGGVSGGTITGADSIVRNGNADTAAADAIVGGVLGAAGSVAAPYIASGAGKMLDAGQSMLARLGVGNATPKLPYSKPAQQAVSRVLAGDGSLGVDGMVNIAQGGPRAMVADAGPGAQSLLDTAIQRSGPGARSAFDAVEARAGAANQDIQVALDRALGKPQGIATMQDGVRNGTAAARQQAYKAAYSQPIDYAAESGMQIEGLLKRVPQDVINTANRMMKMEGVESSQILASIGDDGAVTYMRMPDVRQIDYLTRALNQAAKSGEGQGALGGQTDIGRVYGNLAREIRDVTRSAVPAYDNALRTAANPIQLRQAMQFGTELLRPGTARDVASETIGAMTPPELDAARIALRGHLDETFANVRTAISDPNADAREARKALMDLSGRAPIEKITMLIKDPSEVNAFFKSLSEARRALELRAGVADNSKSFARLAMDQAVSGATRDGVVNTALRGEPVNVAKSVVQSITGRTPQGEQAMSDAVYGDIAKMMTLQGDDAINLLSLLNWQKSQRAPVAAGLPGAVAPAAQSLAQWLGS